MAITIRDYQQEAIDKTIESLKAGNKRIMIVLPTGGGKCFAKGTGIMMFDGSSKNVEDIQIGDKLMGYDSKPRTVKSTCVGTENMYDIIPVKGDKYTVNESHILSLKITGSDYVYCGGKKFKSGDIANVCVRDYLKATKTFKHVAKGWRTGVEFEHKDVLLDPYLLGIWLGDGTHNNACITNTDPEILEYIESYSKFIGCFVRNDGIMHYISSGKSQKIRNVFLDSLKSLNLIGNKHIPDMYLKNSRDIRLKVLAGILDTDGYYDHGYDFITKSERLCDDVLFLCRSLGFSAYKKKVVKGCVYNGEYKSNYYYRMNINGNLDEIPCRVKRRQAEKRRQVKNVLHTGITVVPVGIGTYYGFELEEENRLFLLSDFTVAHNTAIASELVRRSYEKGKSSTFMCHRQELLDQTYATYAKNDIIPAFIKGGRNPDYNNPMQIASVNTLVKRLDMYKKPDIIFWDETQHLCSSTWKKIYERYKDSVHIGLTATPCRLDGKPLGDMYDDMIEVTTVKKLIKSGYLCPYLYYAPSVIDTSELKSSGGDYTKKSLEEASFNSKIIGDNIAQYKKIANGRRNVVFAISRRHGRAICERYNEAGVSAEFLDGETHDRERKAVLERFKNGQTKVLVNVDLFGEGFDLPAIEVVSLLRPTQSLSLYLQQVGRALRICPEIGKTHAIILDHVNNYKTHGMPDDEREWTLDGKKKVSRKKEESVVRMRRCPECFFAHPPALSCPACGYKYGADGKEIKEVAGELVLVGSDEYKKLCQKEVIVANNYEDLVRIEADRGYKCGWADKQYQLKTGINLRATLEGLEEIARVRNYDRRWAWIQYRRRYS